MIASMRRLTDLSDFARALRSVGIIITMAVVGTLLLMSFRGLPAQAENHEKRIIELEVGRVNTDKKLDHIICMLGHPDLVGFQMENACP